MARSMKGGVSLWVGSALVVSLLTCFASGWAPSEAQASQEASTARLEASIAALEARLAALAPLEKRVASLEAKLRRYENAAAPQAVAEPAPLLVSLTGQASEPKPMLIAPEKTAMLEQEQQGNWGGFYWGASFGYGSGNANSKYSNTRTERTSTTDSGSDRSFNDEGSLSYESLSNSSSSYNEMESYSSLSGGSLRNDGALADLYLGANAHLTPRILAGVQVEGTLSQMPFDSKIKGEKGTLRTSSKERYSSSSSSGPGDSYQSDGAFDTNSKETYKRNFDETANLELDWMVSVIGRAGWLATPTTFVYGLGGWSYAHFDVGDLPQEFGLGQLDDFHANGPTVGGGIETKLSPKWSLRAEYRYTDFGKHSFSSRSRTSGNGSGGYSSAYSDKGVCCGGDTFSSSSSGSANGPSTSVTQETSKGSFDNDLHVGRIGVTRYFEWD